MGGEVEGAFIGASVRASMGGSVGDASVWPIVGGLVKVSVGTTVF